MRNKISKFINLQGKYLTSLLFALLLGIGQMWGDQTIYLFQGTSSNVEGTTLNTADFFTTAEVKTNSTGAEIADKSSLTKYISLGNAGSSATNDPAKYIQYDCKTTSTQIEVYALNTNTNSGNRTVYWKHKKEGKTAFESDKSTAYNNSTKKSGKSDYTFTNETNSEAVNATVYIQVSDAKLHIYQVVVIEKGTPLKKVGDVGYSIGFATGKRPALKGGTACRIDGFEILASSNFTPASTSEVALVNANSNYIKFALDETRKVTVKLNSNYKVFFAKSVKAVGTETQYGGSAGEYDAVLGAGTWYLQPVASSNPKVQAITFAAPPTTYTVTFDNNDHGGTAPAAQSGITSGGKATEPTEPEDASYNFGGWYNMEDWADPSAEKWNFSTSTVTRDTTLYAKWTDKSVKSDDATLNAFSIDGYSFTETFAATTLDYTVNMPFYASIPATSAVHATKNDTKATLGDVTYDSTNKKYSVTVTAEDKTTTKTYTITLNIASTPTASSSINIEQLVLDYGKKYDIDAAFATVHIGYDKKGNTDELDSLKNQSGRNEPYLGLKMKKTDASITVVVPAENTLKVKFGNLPSAGIKVTINGVAQANHTSGNFELAATSAIREVVLAAPSTSTIVFKQIMVGADIQSVQLPWLVTYDAGEHGTCATAKETWKGSALTLPSVTPDEGWSFDGWKDDESNAASSPYTPTKDVVLTAQYTALASPFDLTALTYKIGTDEAVNVGYEDGTFTYNIELPYAPSYNAITVAPTLKESTSYLKGDEVLTVSSLPGAATFTVVAAGGSSEQLYTVNFKKAAKDGICIIKATPTSGSAATADGLYKGSAAIKANSSKKLSSSYDYVSVELMEGKSFLATDKVVLNQTADLGDATDITKFYIFTETPANNKEYVTVNNADPKKGDNWFTMPEEMEGESALYIGRVDAKCNPTVGYLAVYRAMNPVLKKMTVAGVDGIPNNLNAITIEVPYSTPATALASITYDWVSNSDAWTAAHAPVVANEWAFGVANTVTLEDKDGDQTVYTVTINKAAASAVNTLKYLEIDGVEVDVPGNGIYYITEPVAYGTQPEITAATTTDANATRVISNTPVHYVDENNDFWYVQVVVTPEDQIPAHKGYYQVRYTNLPKMGVTLIKGALTSNTAATITGLVGGTYDLSISTQEEDGGYKVNDQNYFGLTLADGYFQNGDIIAIEVTKASTSGGSTMAVYSDNSASVDKLITNSGALGKVGMNYFVLSIPTNVENLNTLYIARNNTNNPDNQWNGYVKSFEVMRVMDGMIKNFSIGGVAGTIDQANKTIAVEVPKGTALTALTPNVEAYANGGATVTPTGAQDFSEGAVNYTVTSAYPTEDDEVAYAVTVTEGNKYLVDIFDGTAATQAAALKASPNAATGASWSLVGLSVSSSSFAGYNYKIATGGSTGTSKHIAVTVPANYLPQFVITHVTNSNNSARNAMVGTSTSKPASTEAALFYVTNSDQYNPSTGTSDQLNEETTYYIHSDNSINFLKIALLMEPIMPKCEAPSLSGLADMAVCALGDALTVTASTTDGGSFAYQWYKKGETDIEVGTNSNEYIPEEVGQYYVVVTHSLAEHRDNVKTSDVVTVSVKAATAITAYANAAGPISTPKTLSVTAENALSYKWQACDENGLVTDETILGTAATYGVTITEEPQYYLVTVHGDCGDPTQVLSAKEWHEVELQDVTGSMTWSFAKSNLNLTEDAVVASTMVLANVGQGIIPNKSDFRSDMLMALVGTTTTKVRYNENGGCYQGDGIKFNTTVPGIVTVEYRGTGNNDDVTLTIGSETLDTYHGAFTVSKKVFVPAGEVKITSVGTMRIKEIVFNATPDYPRAVTEGRYGTICLPNGGVMTGATIFEIAYMDYVNNQPYKIYFDEVLNGKMEAGMPYIFLPNEGATQLGVFYTDAANAPAGHYHGLYGSYTKELLAQNAGNYILKNNQYYLVNSDLVYVGENRAYIYLAEVPNYNPGQPANGRRRVSMNVNAEQTTTDLENLSAGEQPMKMVIDGKLFILRGEKLFDATGRLVK